MTDLILQSRLPVLPWMDPSLWRLPGVQPLDAARWLEVDDAYAAQMAEKTRLIASNPNAVHALQEQARPAAEEALEIVLAQLSQMEGFIVGAEEVTRPDGVTVAIDRQAPLLTLGALVQEDICLLQKVGNEHVLTGALLCFPASWTLAEKIGRPLSAIHAPVLPYDELMTRRVQRMFDTIRPDNPLWRMNALLYANPALHQPKSEANARPRVGARNFLRSEKQCFVKLPASGAVVFSIHTYVVLASTLTEAERAALVDGGH